MYAWKAFSIGPGPQTSLMLLLLLVITITIVIIIVMLLTITVGVQKSVWNEGSIPCMCTDPTSSHALAGIPFCMHVCTHTHTPTYLPVGFCDIPSLLATICNKAQPQLMRH